MKADTIAYIQKELGKFVPVIRALSESYLSFDVLKVLDQLVSNFVVGDRSESDTRVFYNSIDQIHKYEANWFVTNYICSEIRMIVDGNEMSEDMEDEIPLPYNPDQDVCPKCFEYMIYHENGICPR